MVARNAPAIDSGVPAPTVASVVMFEMKIATDGTTATLPPAAPVFACAVPRCVVAEATVRLPPPMSVPVSSAVVVSSMTTTTTEAPMPTEAAPLTPPLVESAGSALALVVESDEAWMETSPLPAVRRPPSDAMVWMFSISMATDPATPTAPPPAPLFADAPSLFCAFPSAVMVAPFALTVLSGGALASLVTRT